MSDQPTSSRLDRVEVLIEKLAERQSGFDASLDAFRQGTEDFQRAVRGAFMAQQEQIAENTRNIAALLEVTKEHAQSMKALERQWQVYLSTIHPKQ